MLLRDIMATDVVYATPEMNLREAMNLLASKHISGAPVVDRGKVVGVFSSTDLLSLVARLDDAQPAVTFRQRTPPLEEVAVADVMTREVLALGPSCPIETAAAFMRHSAIHRILVMEEERLLGIVSTTDLAAAVADQKPCGIACSCT